MKGNFIRFCAVFLCCLSVAFALCGCGGVKDFSFAGTKSQLTKKGFGVPDKKDTAGFYVLSREDNTIDKNIISKRYEVLKQSYPAVYRDFEFSFTATSDLNIWEDASGDEIPLIKKGGNNWSSVIYALCRYDAVERVMEFWGTDKKGEPIWFFMFECRDQKSAALKVSFAQKLKDVLLKINQTISGNQTENDKAYSWALKCQTNIAISKNCVVIYTANSKGLIA